MSQPNRLVQSIPSARLLQSRPQYLDCATSGNRVICTVDLGYLPQGVMIMGGTFYVLPKNIVYTETHYGGAGGRQHVATFGQPLEF